MPAGLNALQKAQAFLETTRGTAAAATRIVYFDRGAWFEQIVGKEFPSEDRNSFVDNYRQVITDHRVQLSGGADATFDDLAWWGQIFWKGSVAAVLSNTSVYTRTFQPTVATDDLQTATLEIGNDTQAYQVPYCLGQKLELDRAGRPSRCLSTCSDNSSSRRPSLARCLTACSRTWLAPPPRSTSTTPGAPSGPRRRST